MLFCTRFSLFLFFLSILYTSITITLSTPVSSLSLHCNYSPATSFFPCFFLKFFLKVPPSYLLFLLLPAFVPIHPVLMFRDKWTWVEAALLPVRIEGSHRRPSVVHLINQPPLQHETVETCICSDGACSYTSPIIINRVWKKDGVACTGYSAIFLTELNSWLHRVQPQEEGKTTCPQNLNL